MTQISPAFRPLLAAAVLDTAKLKFPVYASIKLDGIRCTIIDGVATSRSLKPLPNRKVQILFGKHKFNGLDGELTCGDPTAYDCFKRTTSMVMSEDSRDSVVFRPFDHCLFPKMAFAQRFELVREIADAEGTMFLVRQHLMRDHHELDAFVQQVLVWGYEGVIVRSPDGIYKFGRSTIKEGILLKIKPFSDTEGTIIGATELFHNANPAFLDERGFTKRSTAKEGKVGTGTLGSFKVKAPCFLEPFEIGTGFTEAERKTFWEQLPSLLGTSVKFKYQALGSYNKPRCPVFLGFRQKGT